MGSTIDQLAPKDQNTMPPHITKLFYCSDLPRGESMSEVDVDVQFHSTAKFLDSIDSFPTSISDLQSEVLPSSVQS